MTNPPTSPSGGQQSDRENLVGEVAEVVNAALGVGAALAKVAARATSGDQAIPAQPSDSTPIGEMIYYSVRTVTNVFGLVIGNLGSVAQIRKTQSGQPSTRTAQAPAEPPPVASTPSAGLPSIRQGATLRVPLSIENPTNNPMSMAFVCVAMKAETPVEGEPLSVDAVRFQPATIEVVPKDFEKLTVFVDTTPRTALGRYEATISTAHKTFEMTLQFEVV